MGNTNCAYFIFMIPTFPPDGIGCVSLSFSQRASHSFGHLLISTGQHLPTDLWSLICEVRMVKIVGILLIEKACHYKWDAFVRTISVLKVWNGPVPLFVIALHMLYEGLLSQAMCISSNMSPGKMNTEDKMGLKMKTEEETNWREIWEEHMQG